jgi:hypothetical protein
MCLCKGKHLHGRQRASAESQLREPQFCSLEAHVGWGRWGWEVVATWLWSLDFGGSNRNSFRLGFYVMKVAFSFYYPLICILILQTFIDPFYVPGSVTVGRLSCWKFAGWLGVLVYACNPNSQQGKAGGLRVWGCWALVAHAFNPSYLEGGDQEDHSSRPVGANSL